MECLRALRDTRSGRSLEVRAVHYTSGFFRHQRILCASWRSPRVAGGRLPGRFPCELRTERVVPDGADARPQ